jgi:hypothetical protein
MTERPRASDPTPHPTALHEMPTADIAAFIRHCHRRRGLKWPELYDEMCGVAARREFNGWDHAELAARGVTFSLLEMPRLAAWARAVLADEAPIVDVTRGPGRPALEAALA